jgi:N-acetylneuraminic acid mutarotase
MRRRTGASALFGLISATAGCGDDTRPGPAIPSPSGGSAGSGAAAGTSSGGAGGAAGSGGTLGTGGTGGTGGTAGGGTDGGALEPPPGSYGRRADLLAANSEMAVAEVDGKIYVLGGYPASREVQSTVQVYDVATDAWSLGTSLPVAIHHPVAVGVAGKLYSIGGQLVGDTNTNRTLVLDPRTDRPWQDLALLPTPRGAGAAAVIDDKIYVVGGRPPAANAFEVYDIGDDAWTPLPDLPGPTNRNHLAAAAIDGKIYVAGGRHTGGSFADPMTDALDVFDPGSGMWSSGAALPRPRGGMNGIAAFGCFYVWGGEGANIGEPNNVFPDHDVFDPRANAWTSLPPLPTPVHGVTGAAFVNGLIYMPGGGTRQGGSSGSTLFQVYRPGLRCDNG